MRISDWSSDVCSSDLLRLRHRRHDRDRGDRPPAHDGRVAQPRHGRRGDGPAHGLDRAPRRDRKSGGEGKSVSVRVDIGWGRIHKKKKKTAKRVYTLSKKR